MAGYKLAPATAITRAEIKELRTVGESIMPGEETAEVLQPEPPREVIPIPEPAPEEVPVTPKLNRRRDRNQNRSLPQYPLHRKQSLTCIPVTWSMCLDSTDLNPKATARASMSKICTRMAIRSEIWDKRFRILWAVCLSFMDTLISYISPAGPRCHAWSYLPAPVR